MKNIKTAVLGRDWSLRCAGYRVSLRGGAFPTPLASSWS